MATKGNEGGLPDLRSAKITFCEGCAKGKLARKPFKAMGEVHSTEPLELVHSDVCRPMSTSSMSGMRYMITFVDDYSHNGAVYFMKNKSEALTCYQPFQRTATTDCGRKIRTLRTDNSREYLNFEFDRHLASQGTRHQLSVAYTLE